LKYSFNYHRAFSAAVSFLLSSLLFPCPSFEQEYLWPTTASKLITSSFGEFRPRHYHAAIDIKTWNRSGYPVMAIEDGYVLRARISAFGYGKAIYLKLNDGNTVVYAHLSKFWPELENYLDQQRLKNKEYRIDRQFTSQQFPVKRGQIIGYSGKSGIGYPHLHFEIRDPQNRPVNPLQYYRTVLKDQTPPALYQLAFIPMDYRSLINKKSETVFYEMGGGNKFQLTDTLLFTGKIGLGLKSYDQAGGASNEFSFYRAEMRIDDSLVYSVRYDHFSYEQTEKVELDKNFELWRQGQGIFHNFFIHPENNLPFYNNYPPESGIIDHRQLSEGVHQLSVNIFDYSNNSASFEAYFRCGRLPAFNYDLFRWIEDELFIRLFTDEHLDQIRVQQQDTNGNWSIVPFSQEMVELEHDHTFYYTFALVPAHSSEKTVLRIEGLKGSEIPSFPLFLNIGEKIPANDSLPVFETTHYKIKNNWLELTFQLHHPRPVTLLSELAKQLPEIFWFATEDETFQLNLPIRTYVKQREVFQKVFNLQLDNLYYVDRDKQGKVISADQYFSAVFPPQALYEDAGIFLSTIDNFEQHPLPKRSKAAAIIYDLQPFTQPVDGGVWISLTVPSGYLPAGGIGLYYWDQKKGWQFIPAKFDSTTLSFKTRVTSLEKFTLIQDTIPPTILPGQSLNLASIQGQNGLVKFFIKDELSGMQTESMIQVFLDGQWQLFEYDPEEDYITLDLPSDMTTPASLKISAQDNVGNTAVKTFQIK